MDLQPMQGGRLGFGTERGKEEKGKKNKPAPSTAVPDPAGLAAGSGKGWEKAQSGLVRKARLRAFTSRTG